MCVYTYTNFQTTTHDFRAMFTIYYPQLNLLLYEKGKYNIWLDINFLFAKKRKEKNNNKIDM